MSDDDGLDLSVGDAATGTGDSGSNRSRSSSGSSSSSRSLVTVKGEFGTEQYEPDTECEECPQQAEGVLVYDGELFGRNPGMTTGRPLCVDHRRELEAMNRFQLDKYEYITFEDE